MDIDKNYWDIGTALLYLSIMLLGTIFCKQAYNKKNGMFSNVRFFVAFIPMFLIIVLRDISRGNDSDVYFSMFQNLKISSIGEAFSSAYFLTREPLYGLCEFILSITTTSLNDDILLIVYFSMQTVLWMVFVFFALKEEARYIGLVLPFVVMFGLFLPLSFNIIRNLIAVCIMLYAYTQLAKGNEKRFLVFNAIAFGFHYTAVFCLVSYFVVYCKNKVLKYGTLCATIVFFLFGATILSNIFGGLDSRYSNMGDSSEAFGLGLIAKRIPFLALVLLLKKQLINVNPHNKLYINLLLFDLLICQAGYVNPMFNRLALYFSAVKIFIIPSFYEVFKKKYGTTSAHLIFPIMLLLWILWSFDEYISTNPYNFMPYFSPYFNL